MAIIDRMVAAAPFPDMSKRAKAQAGKSAPSKAAAKKAADDRAAASEAARVRERDARAQEERAREDVLQKPAAPLREFQVDALDARSYTLDEAAEREREVLTFCKKNKCKWTDSDFPQDNRSIVRGNKRLLKNVDHWERLTERCERPSLFVGGSGSGDVVQGEVGDCWFLGALAMCSNRQDDLLYPLFVSAHPEIGFFQIRFYIDGKWRVVSVDDFVPVKRSGGLIFAHCKDDNEYWVPLVEKAFAKLNGCYENLSSGNFSEAMTDLTGEGSEACALTPEMAESDEMWKKLEYYVAEQFLMGCSIEGVGEHDNGMGLLTGHAYGIMSCRILGDGTRLLKLFNPWGMKEWTGAWSDGSKEWTPELERELEQTDEDDGMFWMTYEDWLANYNMFSVCRLLTDDFGKIWEKTVYLGEWDAQTSGGCCNYPSWNKNPQYWLKIPQPTQMFFHLSREDGRMHGRPIFTEAIGCYIFHERDIHKRKVHRFPNDTYSQPLFIASREYSFSAVMEPGSYLLVPCTFDPGQVGRFFLSVYAEDPVLTGEVGYGPSRKSEVVRLDIGKIAALNRGNTPPPQRLPAAAEVSPPSKKVPISAPVVADAEPKCYVCKENLKGGGKVFRYDGNRYHVKCFRCSHPKCKVQLDPSDFYQDEDGRPVCADHNPE